MHIVSLRERERYIQQTYAHIAKDRIRHRERYRHTHSQKKETLKRQKKKTYRDTKTAYTVNDKLFLKICKNHKFTGTISTTNFNMLVLTEKKIKIALK